MTDFLDNPEIRAPLMMYLFERVENLIDGRRICIVIDEFWKALGDEAFRDLAQNKLKTIRKQNGLMLFATQSPRDAILSPIAHTIIEQCPTQIFMPNPRGNAEDYVDGFKLTEQEFELISADMTNESRRFLVKQGHNSVVVELNLQVSTTSWLCCPAAPRRWRRWTGFAPSPAITPTIGCPCSTRRDGHEGGEGSGRSGWDVRRGYG